MNLENENSQYQLTINCPKCKAEHTISLLQVTNGETIECTKCQFKIALETIDPEAEKRKKKNFEELSKLKRLLRPISPQKNMKLTVFFVLFSLNLSAQVAGNANLRYSNSANTLAQPEADSQLNRIVINALALVPAERFVAVFNLKNFGENVSQITKNFEAKQNVLHSEFKKTSIQFKISNDLISFLPVYTITQEKKLFKTATEETPIGFEMQQNLMVEYTKASDFVEIMRIMAENGIYNLLKVEYLSSKVLQMTDSLRQMSFEVLKKRKQMFKIAGVQTNESQIRLSEKVQIINPSNAYKSVRLPRTELDETKGQTILSSRGEQVAFYQNSQGETYNIVLNGNLVEPTLQIQFQLIYDSPIQEPRPAKYLIQSGNGFIPLDIQK